MAVIILTWFVRKKGLLLSFWGLFSLFISENIFSKKEWTKDYMDVEWLPESNAVLITIVVYDYSYGPASEHGYLERCKFNACLPRGRYLKLMNIHTRRQLKSNITSLHFNDKHWNAIIQFKYNVVKPAVNQIWNDNTDILVKILNEDDLAIVTFVWYLSKALSDISGIRIHGKWSVDPPCQRVPLIDVVYSIDKTSSSKFKSNIRDINTKVSVVCDSVKVIKNSETIASKYQGLYDIRGGD